MIESDQNANKICSVSKKIHFNCQMVANKLITAAEKNAIQLGMMSSFKLHKNKYREMYIHIEITTNFEIFSMNTQ